MTGAQALRQAVPRLAAAGVEDAARDARVLLAHALGIAADRLTLHLPNEMTEAQARAYEEALRAREARQPVAQITGRRLFWGQWFRVTRDTLDRVSVRALFSGPFLLERTARTNSLAAELGADLIHGALGLCPSLRCRNRRSPSGAAASARIGPL